MEEAVDITYSTKPGQNIILSQGKVNTTTTSTKYGFGQGSREIEMF